MFIQLVILYQKYVENILFWNVKGLSFKIGHRVPLSLPHSKTIQKDVTRKNGKNQEVERLERKS